MRHTDLRIEHNGEIINTRFIAGFHLTETNYAPRIKVPIHSHRHACFCLVLGGSYTELYRRKAIECKPSTLIFRPADEVHADHIGSRQVRCFIIEAEPEWLTRLHDYSIRMNEPVSFNSSSIIWLAMRLRNELQQMDDLTSLTVEGLMLELVVAAARGSEKIDSRTRPPWLERAKEILHESFNEGLTLTNIAEAVGVHPVYLAEVFRRHYRCSVGDYARRLRIEFASRELCTTDCSLVEVALAAGFTHQAHFSRTFKRFTGLTPSQYRSSFRQT